MRTHQLPGDMILGKLLYDRSDLWQLSLLDEGGIDEFCRSRGLASLFLGDHVRLLWKFGFLYADLITSKDKLDIEGLILIGENGEENIYADERQVPSFQEGFPSGDNDLPPLPKNVKLFFHPFRYYVIYHIIRVLELRITPVQILLNQDAYPKLIRQEIDYFKEFSSNKEFVEKIKFWDRTAALAIVSEPYFFTKLFGTLRRPVRIDPDEFENQIRSHWSEIRQCYLELGLDKIEKMRRDLCIAAEMTDPNKHIHTLLRLIRGERRYKNIKGSLGGALWLKTIAEILRRGSEDVFETTLDEEDELGFGIVIKSVKNEIYGSDRIIDASDAIKDHFIKSQGLDYGVRLNWYVEGYTEYYAIDSIFGNYNPIEIFNLRGQVVQKNFLAFRDNLRKDIDTKTFSFVSIDGDRSDYQKPTIKAIENEEIVGRVFISIPDFEFYNFTMDELETILWEYYEEAGLPYERRADLRDAISDVENAKELLISAAKAISEVKAISKGEEWGKRLMDYAQKHPDKPESLGGDNTERPIIEAIQDAVQSVGMNYELTRNRVKLDPKTLEPVLRLV